MTIPASHLLVAQPPVWVMTGCSVGFDRVLLVATAGQVRVQLRPSSGLPPGDPVRAAKAIVDGSKVNAGARF